jgi:hypothetical protein
MEGAISFTSRMFYPQGRDPRTHWIEVRLGPLSVWTLWCTETFYAPAKNGTPAVEHVAHCYTDSAILTS